LLATIFVAAPLIGSPWPLRAAGILVALLAAAYTLRVVRVGVTVGTNGLGVRGILSSRHFTWSEVAGIDDTSGPLWLTVVSGRPLRASARLTERLATSTVIRLRNGAVLRPLALTHSFPSRRAEEVTRLARQLAQEQHG
jgi:hypothetical protein